ncbi:MAG: acetoacetate--CoA ligase [Desulfobacteraceae bacterium]|nr:acetoacetate--CoA ligase [Desulfobacteraceae bacterium]
MPKQLWAPTDQRIQSTNMYAFMHWINKRFNQDFKDYSRLYQWSIDHIPDFWAAWWDYVDLQNSQSYTQVIDDLSKMPGAKWFEGARLNFAEHLLRYRDDQTALIFYGEEQVRRKISYAELYTEVAQVQAALKAMDIEPGDRVVGFMPNMPQTIVAMLAATGLGATWSSCSPDFGIKGVLDRFGQIKPKVLFTADGYFFKGKRLDSLERIAQVTTRIPSIQKVVVVPYTQDQPHISSIANAVHYGKFKIETATEAEFVQLGFDHPLYIMYSSGTTGLPKCMVQSAGGILLHHLKELILHTDLKREDTIFYFTTCGWMMWNWLVSSLAVGATLVLFDGNPFHPSPKTLWKMAEDEKITVFGTSAGYIEALQASDLKPADEFDLCALRAVLSTGSPLSEEGFEFVYRHIKSDVQLASIAGGTDLNGCFALGNPMGPVYAGELQCRALAMKVEAFDENAKSIIGQLGELVCCAPFPSMPIYFWNDKDGKKYHRAYFDVYPNVWRHGDFIAVTERGGVVMYGRSDATLNPGGVRIGTSEIYRQVDTVEEVEDSVVVGQNWKNDTRVILFVKLAQDQELTETLIKDIKNAIRSNTSPRHVPAKIIRVPDIPYTLNMKKVELAVRKIIHGQQVENKEALRNPECLDYFAHIKELEEE